MRLAVDTNVLICRALWPGNPVGRAARHIIDNHIVLVSPAVIREVGLTLYKKKFEPFISAEKITAFLADLSLLGEPVTLTERIHACRDPDDDIWLELAVNGHADGIITGDDDLLALHPFRGIPILSPQAYAALQGI